MIKHLLLFATCILSATLLLANDFTEKQQAIIYNEAIKTLSSYQDIMNQLADAVVDLDASNKLSQRTSELFINRKALVYNDLDPLGKMSEYFELETYMTNLVLWYPDGMKISLDFKNLKAGSIISHGNDICTIDLLTSKTNNGNYLNRQKNELKTDVLYRIAFFQQGNGFSNFKIAGVRSTTSKNLDNANNSIAEVKSANFSEKDMLLIKDQTKALINDYINFLNLMADPNETNEDKVYYKISFMSLFKDSTQKVANDIEPEPTERWVSVIDYQQKFMNEYPEGIKNLGVNLDSAEYGKVIAEGNERFYINGYIDKYFSGKYQSKTVFRDNSRYDFKVSFQRDENTFKNFKLSSIDKFGVNLYDTKSENTAPLPSLAIEPISRKGFQYGLFFGAGTTQYTDPNLTESPVLEWAVQNKAQYSILLKGSWYYNGYVGISSGVGFSHAAVQTSLNGDYTNNTYSYDAYNISHVKSVNAAVDSNLNFNYLEIPLVFVFHCNPSPEKWSIVAELGMNTGINMGSNYQLAGQYATSGYYEQLPGTIKYQDDPRLGFVNETLSEEPQKAEIKPLNISLVTSLGISYPLDYFTSLNFGVHYQKGLTDISATDTYTDYLGNNLPAEKRTLSNFGVKFGINYKF